MRFGTRPVLRRSIAIVMMAAAVAFVLQGFFVATSEAATGDASHYHHGFAFSHAYGESAAHSHILSHVHADGTVHQHAVDDDDDDDHVKQSGWNMAIVVGVVPCPALLAVAAATGSALPIAPPPSLRVADRNGLRKPPRPPGIT